MKRLIKNMIGNTTVLVVRSLFKTKAEKELILRRGGFYSQFFSSRDDIYFDIGANLGNRIEPLIDKGIRIIAVEPQSQCVEFLRRKFGERITIVPKGVGDTEGEMTIFISDAHVISSFSKEWISATQGSGRFSGYTYDKEQTVEMVTLDTLIRQFGTPRFIKIDVEGFEVEVLKGLSHPIDFISFEYTVPERTQSINDCIDRIVVISEERQVQFNYSVGESLCWASENWMTPEEMKRVVSEERFVRTGFGDIYARTSGGTALPGKSI